MSSDYLSDDDHSVTTGSAFIRRFIPEMCSVHFCFSFKFFDSFFLQKRELSLEFVLSESFDEDQHDVTPFNSL